MVPMEGTDTSFVDSFIEYCLPVPSIVSGILLVCCIIKDWYKCQLKNVQF